MQQPREEATGNGSELRYAKLRPGICTRATTNGRRRLESRLDSDVPAASFGRHFGWQLSNFKCGPARNGAVLFWGS